jgi:shikimate dehydrogenase
MKKYLVIGNPIEHSLSPKIHNYWIKKNNIEAFYEKRKVIGADIKKIILDIKQEKIHGMNVTLPFKKKIIPYLDQITKIAEKTRSVNTIYKKNNKIIGDNTDVGGFERSLENLDHEIQNKRVLILGAGGVVSSLIYGLKNLGVGEIVLSNRTKKNALKLQEIYSDLKIINWGTVSNFDIVINATSLGLKSEDKLKIDFKDMGKNKLFYDVIYNPSITNFLKEGEKLGSKIENGKMMFVYQAQIAFKIWHNILPVVDEKIMSLLEI